MIRCDKCKVLCPENEDEEGHGEGILGIRKTNGEVLCVECMCEELAPILENNIACPKELENTH